MVGKIIASNYFDLGSQSVKVGYFLIIYDEQFDDNTKGNGNMIGLKITSNTRVDCNYKIPINHYSLKKPSVLLCSKFYVIDKKTQQIDVMGGVNDKYMDRVFFNIDKFYMACKKQLKERRKYFNDVKGIPSKNWLKSLIDRFRF